MIMLRRASIIVGILLLTGACQLIQAVSPSISDVVGPADVNTTAVGAGVSSTARVDTTGWGVNTGVSDIYLTWAAAADDLRTPVANQIDPSCTALPGDATIFDCVAAFGAPTGTWFFQWHIDFGENASDLAWVSRPQQAGSFTITQVQPPPPDDDDGEDDTPPPPPDDLDPDDPLVLFEPADGNMCAGNYVGNVTIVGLAWRSESTAEYQSLPGDYQVIVEHAEGPNCTNAEDLGLDLSAANAAWGYQPGDGSSSGCYVVPHNINGTATPGVESHRLMSARVRRILDGGLFGDYSNTVTFRTAGPPLVAPERLAPLGDTIDLPDNIVGSTVEFRFRAPGCPPTVIDFQILEDEGDGFELLSTGTASCGTNPADPQECVFSPASTFDRGNIYNVNIVQYNQWGSYESGFNLTIE